MVVRALAFLTFRCRAHFCLCPAANLRDQTRHTFLHDRCDFHIVVAEGNGKRIESAELRFLDRQHDALIPKQTRQFDQVVCAREFDLLRNKTALSDFSIACWAWK